MKDNRFIQGLSGLAIAAAGAALLAGWHGLGSPSLDARTHEAAGRGIAREAIRLLAPGAEVSLITRDTGEAPNPADDTLLSSFKAELSRARVKLGHTQSIHLDPLRPREVPASDFLDCLHRTSKGHVLVSLLGPPPANLPTSTKAAEERPAVVVFCTGSAAGRADFQALFDKGLIQCAIVSRSKQAAGSSETGSREPAFDAHFRVLTPANLSNATW
jgi:hypothetical protein